VSDMQPHSEAHTHVLCLVLCATHPLGCCGTQRTGDTTAVGEPMPGPQGRLAHRPAAGGPGLAPTTPSSRSGLVQALTYPLAMGFGVGLTFALIRMLIG
jgi:hypothetical protein